MKLWTCMMIDNDYPDSTLLGIFSTREKAEEQARIWIEGVTEHRGEVNDREVNNETGEEIIYYRARNGRAYDHYTAHIEIYTLDEMSY